ncbi:hypothetical protein [Candidatus Parabeggiatoa sp. HSG14]|nr:hypothetical protein [Thiotrichales bacterium HSG14]
MKKLEDRVILNKLLETYRFLKGFRIILSDGGVFDLSNCDSLILYYK